MVNFGENGLWFQCVGHIGQVHKKYKWMGEIIKLCRICSRGWYAISFGMMCGVGSSCE
jgi:hypothetical protein